MNKCRFFRGVQHKTCEAGVELAPLRDTSGPGMARWPCLELSEERKAATACEKRSFLSADERRAEVAELELAVAAVESGKCPTCGATLAVRDGGGGGAIVKICSTHGVAMRGCKVIDD